MIDERFFHNKGPLSVHQIVALTGTHLDNEQALDQEVRNVASLEDATQGDIACFHNAKYLEAFQNTKAGFCFVSPDLISHAPQELITLSTPSPYRAFGLTASAFYPDVDRVYEACPTAIHPSALIDETCIIEPGAVIQARAKIGRNTRIGANTVIGRGVEIGENSCIEPGVTISHALIGNSVILSAGVRIGQAGFGFFMDALGHVKVPQLGRVIIHDDVEIGANTTVDRGSMQDTMIGKGCRIDNLVQIAHNARLGRGCVLVAQCGVAGSTHLGDHVVVAGQVGIAGHLSIGNRVHIAAQSGVMKSIEDGEVMAGTPCVPVRQWHRQTLALAKMAQSKGSK